MYNIVWLDQASFPENNNQLPTLNFPHKLTRYAATTAQQVIERCLDADIIITNKVLFNKSIISQLPKLKLIAITATGTNNVDLEAAEQYKISVKNVTRYSNLSVTEHVISLIFALRRGLLAYNQDQLTAQWTTSQHFCYYKQPILDVKNTVLGIVGKGNLGNNVATMAKALGMQVIFLERQHAVICRDGYVPFEEGMATADIISLHCPLTTETANLINDKTISLMKPTAILINTGRGGLVDERALANALYTKKIAAAGLDVLSTEPPSIDNPLIKAAQKLPNLIITPHIAWASNSAVTSLLAGIADNINNWVLKNSN